MQTAHGKEIKGKSFTVNDLMTQISAPDMQIETTEGKDPFVEASTKAIAFLNKSLEEASTIQELQIVHDRASELQQVAAERTLRVGRLLGQLLQDEKVSEGLAEPDEYIPVQERIARSVAEAKGHDAEEIARRLKVGAQDAVEVGRLLSSAATKLDRTQLLGWAKSEFLMDEQDVDELIAVAEKYKDVPLDGLSTDTLFDMAGPYASWYLERYTYPEKQATRSLMNYYQALMKGVPTMQEFHEKTKIVPAMQPDEYARLVYSIHHYGQSLPIKTFKGKIIDGRMRYLACRDAGRLPRIEEWDGDESKVHNYIISANFRRSSLTDDASHDTGTTSEV